MYIYTRTYSIIEIGAIHVLSVYTDKDISDSSYGKTIIDGKK